MTSSFFDQHKNRIIGLDIMRSIAILWVVYIHSIVIFQAVWRKSLIKYNPIGLNGVTIFFVLSGFLIGGILIRAISNSSFTWVDLKQFWIRRWFRTIPLYVLVLSGLLLFKILLGWEIRNFSWRFYFFSQNLFWTHPKFFEEAWSLSVEEWFYLLFPLLFFVLNRLLNDKVKTFCIVTLIFLIVPFCLRVVQLDYSKNVFENLDKFYKVVIFRFDSLIYGILGAIIHFRYPELWKRCRYLCFFLGLILLILLKIISIIFYSFIPLFFIYESIIAFLFLPLLSQLASTGSSHIDRFFIFISVISFSLYLLHSTFIIWHLIPLLDKYFGLEGMPLEKTWPIRYSLFWVLSIGLSYMLYRYFEAPMTKLRERFAKKK